MVYGILVANVIIDFAKKSPKEYLIFKVDFEKAHDSVGWSFLDYMFRRFGIDDKWRAWMRACVFSRNLSVLVNRIPTKETINKTGKNIPLLLFFVSILFLLVAEGLGWLMCQVVASNLFVSVALGVDAVTVSHLQYVDDTLLIG